MSKDKDPHPAGCPCDECFQNVMEGALRGGQPKKAQPPTTQRTPHPQSCACDVCKEAIRAGERGRDQAIARLTISNQEWVSHAINVIHALCLRQQTFTADDVWREVDFVPVERRTMGAATSGAAKLKYCENSNSAEPSKMSACHRRKKDVWRSLLWKP